MAYVVQLRDVDSVLVSGASGTEGDLVEQIKGNCGYVVRGINWVLEQVNIHLLDALFDKLGGDFSTVSVMAEDWRRTGLAAGILADNYREMAAAVPTVWRGDTADAMTAKMEEFAETWTRPPSASRWSRWPSTTCWPRRSRRWSSSPCH